MPIKRLVPIEKAEAVAKAVASRIDKKGIPPTVLTPQQKDEILLTMAEAHGFYDPTP